MRPSSPHARNGSLSRLPCVALRTKHPRRTISLALRRLKNLDRKALGDSWRSRPRPFMSMAPPCRCARYHQTVCLQAQPRGTRFWIHPARLTMGSRSAPARGRHQLCAHVPATRTRFLLAWMAQTLKTANATCIQMFRMSYCPLGAAGQPTSCNRARLQLTQQRHPSHTA